MLSGLFFKDYGLFETFIKKVNKLIIPFFVFNIIGEIYFYIENKFLSSTEPVFQWLDVLLFLKANGVIWFLMALFWQHLIFLAIYRTCKKALLKIIAIFILTIVGLNLSQYSNLYYVSTSLISLPFFAIGYFLKRTSLLKPTKYDKYCILFSIVLFISMIGYINFIENAAIRFHTATYTGTIISAYILSMLGVLATLLLCKTINWLPFFSYIGRYSIIVLCTHIFFVNFTCHIRQKFFGDSTTVIAINAIIVLVRCLIMIPICKKYLPYVVAQKDLIIYEKGKVKFNI